MDSLANVNFTPQPTQPATPPRLSVEQAAKPTRADLDNAKSVAATIAPEASTEQTQGAGPKSAAPQTSPTPQTDSQEDAPPSSSNRAVERSFEIDPGTETLIYRAINSDSGDVVRQVPEEVFLKIRAYNAQSEAGSSAIDTTQNADPTEASNQPIDTVDKDPANSNTA